MVDQPRPVMKQEAEALRESRLKAKAIKAKAFLARVDHVAEKNDARKVRTSPTRNHGTPLREPPTLRKGLTSHRKSTRVF